MRCINCPYCANELKCETFRHLLVSLRSASLLSAWRHACHSSRASVSCFLVARAQPTQGSCLNVQLVGQQCLTNYNHSDEKVILEVDRFDPGRTDGLPTSLLPSDLAISCDILLNHDPMAVSHLLYNLSTFHQAFSFVTQSLHTVTSLDVGRVLAMKVCLTCSHDRIYLIECERLSRFTLHIQLQGVLTLSCLCFTRRQHSHSSDKGYSYRSNSTSSKSDHVSFSVCSAGPS